MKIKTKVAIDDLRMWQKSTDTEIAHSEADRILLRFAPRIVRIEYEKVKKWYG